MRYCKPILLLIALNMGISAGAWAGQERWKFQLAVDPIRDEAKALIYYDSDTRKAVTMAFKCQAGRKPSMLLAVPSPIYEGMGERLQVHVKIKGERDFHFRANKFVETSVSPYLNYSGVAAEVHKLWFLSDKVIGYRAYGGRILESSLTELLGALRDGQFYVELSLGRARLFRRVDRRKSAFTLRGAARAVNKFAQHCGLDLD